MGRFVLTAVAIVGSLLAGVAQSRAAEEITFTYTDPYGLKATGQITVVPSDLKDGSMWAVSGSLKITANPQFLPAGRHLN